MQIVFPQVLVSNVTELQLEDSPPPMAVQLLNEVVYVEHVLSPVQLLAELVVEGGGVVVLLVGVVYVGG